MADILITNGIVVTMDGKRRVIEDGAVAIEKDRIVAVGTTAQVTAKHSAKTVIDASRKIVMPGMVDAHAHAGHGFIKTLGGGRSDEWYKACGYVYTQGSTPEFWRAEAQLAALERLRFGVTTGVSLLGGGDTILKTDDPIYGDAHCDGVKEVGTRSFVAIGSTRPPHPLTYGSWEGKKAKTYPVTFERQFATCEALIKSWHGKHGRRINICLITPTLREEHRQELSKEDMERAIAQAQQVSALARANGLVFTQDGHTTGSVEFAHKMGILGPEALLSHSTGLTADEIRICAETDTKIAHNPSAIASVLARCPAIELMDAGVTVALGSDATAPDRNGDMFRTCSRRCTTTRPSSTIPRSCRPARRWRCARSTARRRWAWKRKSAHSRKARRPTSCSSISPGRTCIRSTCRSFGWCISPTATMSRTSSSMAAS